MNTKSVQTQETDDSNHESSQEHLHLPEPDSDNITVLTNKLPNKPILPWNRYDSPWQHPDESENTESVSDESTDSPADTDTNQVDIQDNNSEELSSEIELDEVE